MKYCSKCGKAINDDAAICIHCGNKTESSKPFSFGTGCDAPNTLFFIVGCCVPIVGLILYLIHIENYPQKANSAGKGALIGVCVAFGITLLYQFALLLSMFSMFDFMDSLKWMQ